MVRISTRRGLHSLICFITFSVGFPSTEEEQDVEVDKRLLSRVKTVSFRP
jgi:hypothetical protein